MKKVLLPAAIVSAVALSAASLARRGRTWGSEPSERSMRLPGDGYLEGGPEARTVMTRAISISAPPELVWPWLAQLGRGAGWYSYDPLDNGGKSSARHIVSWIPPPRIGDASAIGWLRDLEPGRGLSWFLPGEHAFGTTMRMVTDLRVVPEDAGSRLIVRVSADATGCVGAGVVRGFEVIDSIMAVRQLRGIRARAETFGARTADPLAPETGARDQYQLYEAISTTGEVAGVAGRERAAAWHLHARAAAAAVGS